MATSLVLLASAFILSGKILPQLESLQDVIEIHLLSLNELNVER